MVEEDNADEDSINDYFAARLHVMRELQNFLKSQRRYLTFAQGAQIERAIERIDVSHGDYDVSPEEHKRFATDGADALNDLLDEYQHDLDWERGSRLRDLMNMLVDGETPTTGDK